MTDQGRPTPDDEASSDQRRRLLGPLFSSPNRRSAGVSPPDQPSPMPDRPPSPAALDDLTTERISAETSVQAEGTSLPWDAVLRAWLSRRLPNVGRSKWVILTAVLLGNFAAGIVFTLLSVARVTIGEDLGAPPSLVLWAFTAP